MLQVFLTQQKDPSVTTGSWVSPKAGLDKDAKRTFSALSRNLILVQYIIL
jgi:hypothetical protein